MTNKPQAPGRASDAGRSFDDFFKGMWGLEWLRIGSEQGVAAAVELPLRDGDLEIGARNCAKKLMTSAVAAHHARRDAERRLGLAADAAFALFNLLQATDTDQEMSDETWREFTEAAVAAENAGRLAAMAQRVLFLMAHEQRGAR